MSNARCSITTKFDEDTLAAAPPTRPARLSHSYSMEGAIGSMDLIALRELVPSQIYSEEDTNFLSSCLANVVPVARLPPILFGVVIEAHESTRRARTNRPCASTL